MATHLHINSQHQRSPLNVPVLDRFTFKRAANCLLFLAGLIPIALVAAYVVSNGRQGPIGDQWWDPVYIAVKTQTGTLSTRDFFALSEFHRPAVIRGVTALFTIFTHYDTGMLRYSAFVTTLLNLGLAMLLLARGRPGLAPISFFFFATLLFSLNGDENSWLDMYYSTWQQALFFLLLGLLILQRMRPSWAAFALLVLCATAASFTVASGVMAWVSLFAAAMGRWEYRRLPFITLWLLLLGVFLIFYTSDYAVSTFKTDDDTPSLSWALLREGLLSAVADLGALREGLLSAILYLFQFQAARFDTSDVIAIGLILTSILVLGLDLWQISSKKNGVATAALWGALALFALGTAALVLVGRGPTFPVLPHYSPGADGFWLALIGLAFLVISRRPPPYVVVPNAILLSTLAVCAVTKDLREIRFSSDNFDANQKCDQSIVNYPLYRDDTFRKCFYWSEDQSVYHLAALRLSVFRHQTPSLILPRTDAPVIADMPNRWLSVYVRDYMMAGLPSERLFSISPVPGEWSAPRPHSPYYRGEWPTDILPLPLQHAWTSTIEVAPHLSVITSDKPLVWYLNTPETEANFLLINRALTELGYVGWRFPINDARYASARFSLWCFERSGTGGCTP